MLKVRVAGIYMAGFYLNLLSFKVLLLIPVLRDLQSGYVFAPPQLPPHTCSRYSVFLIGRKLGRSMNAERLGVLTDWDEKRCFKV